MLHNNKHVNTRMECCLVLTSTGCNSCVFACISRFIIAQQKGQTWAALPWPACLQPGQIVQAMHCSFHVALSSLSSLFSMYL